ncbi:hypothetical protein ACE01N_10600 [Saccharicrinis sp. FJH2]|uniref:hypothetical protein n=1 Tax=Saccharicrinis sp. FJH65 TaxID=3344659 RepID=UPI0035F2B7B7
MKKLMILTAAVLTLGLSVPTISNAMIDENPVATAPDEITYQEITKDDVPEVITSALSEKFSNFTIDKYYLGSDGNYKVDVSKEDAKWALYFDKEGTVFKKEDLNSDSSEEEQSNPTEE